MSSNEQSPQGFMTYQDMLDDLTQRRDAINQMIEVVKSFMDAAPASKEKEADKTNTNHVQKPPAFDPNNIPGDAFFGMSIPDAVRSYLRVVKKKTPGAEIARSLEKGGIQHTSKDFTAFYKTVVVTLHRIWENQGDIVQIGNDWALAEWYPGRKLEKQKPVNGKPRRGRPPKKQKL